MALPLMTLESYPEECNLKLALLHLDYSFVNLEDIKVGRLCP